MFNLEIPSLVKHYYKKNRVVATVVAVPLLDGYAVGIARANKKQRNPSKEAGRKLAEERIKRGLGITTNPIPDKQFALADIEMNLFRKMTEAEYSTLIQSNPFNDYLVPFGITNEDYEQAFTDAQKRKRKAAAERAKAHKESLAAAKTKKKKKKKAAPMPYKKA